MINPLQQSPFFCIGDIPVYGDVVLAPMDGLSASPYRRIARRLGSAISYSEFLNAQEVLTPTIDLSQPLAYCEEERPLIFQIYDDDPERILSAAQKLIALRPDAIDINMGCSVRRIARRGAGAGLLRSPDKVARIIRLTKEHLLIPITAKIRLGWDDDHKNFLEIGKILQESGADLVAIHGRTKEQGYHGLADWDAIAALKSALTIPVIGNGDVRCAHDIERMLRHTRCDAVMIGRAALGNPWLFSKIDKADIAPQEIHQVMTEHFNLSIDFYGEESGLLRFRRHAQHYLDHLPVLRSLLLPLLTASTPHDFLNCLAAIFSSLQ